MVDFSIAACFGILLASSWGRGFMWHGRVPPWIWFGVSAVVIDVAALTWWPVSKSYVTHRVDLLGLHGEHGPTSLISGLQWLVALFVLPTCMAALAPDKPRRLAQIISAWAWGVGVSCTVALLDSAGVTAISAGLIDVDYSGRQAGLGSHANSLGVSALLAFPIATWIARRHAKRGVLLQTLLVVGIVLSGSRGAQALLVVVMVGMALVLPHARRPLAILGLVALVAAPLAMQAIGGLETIQGTLLRFGNNEGGADSNAERTAVALQGLADFSQRPIFGVGLNQITYAHNIYLQMLSAGGVVLLTGILLLLASVVWEGIRSSELSVLGLYCVISVGIWIVLGLVENSLVDRFLYFPIGVIAGLSILRGQRARPSALGTLA
ncbi:O-antigen ligase family protein [Luteococcus sanguinis]|uniref:O-antigen ligase family protein n=1 Tax=Luteococcus sanguinis TaxID=174038 RepID=A0ABW1X3E7_9ACTN